MRRPLALVVAVVALPVLGTGVTAHAATSRVSTKTLLGQLSVSSEHLAAYDRSKFTLWIDADHDGCNTRQEVLIAEATTRPHVGSSCTLTGGRWFSRYDGVSTSDPSTFDIDHLVPLAEAWQSGAYRWDANTRERYANDLGYGPDLIAVTAHANRSKGEQEPQDWLPSRASFRCRYMAWWVAVKWRWHLRINGAERNFLHDRLGACGWPTVKKPGRPRIGLRSTSGGGDSGSTSGARISAVYFDSPGADTGSNSSLNAEWVRITNVTSSAKSLTGWTLRDASSHVYAFPSFSLPAGASVKVHTGSGSDTGSDLYWNAGYYIWNNSGDTAVLRNGGGTRVDSCAYSSSADPEAFC